METEKNQAEMSWEEKREERFRRWLAPPGVTYDSPAAEKAYKERVTRFIKALKLEKPDRVPVILPSSFFPAHYAGMTLRDVMYDYAKLKLAWLKFLREFDSDSYTTPGLVYPGRVLDAIDYRLYTWPGHGQPDDMPSYQYVEGEYMKPDEYDAFLRDPLDYALRYYLPRTVGAFGPFREQNHIAPFGRPLGIMSLAADPRVQQVFRTLAEAGREWSKWQETVREISRAALAAGFPAFRGGVCVAPFDTFADTLRGTRGIIMDMYRQPDKLHEAMERIVPFTVESAVASSGASASPLVFIPLHKGDDTFMSGKQFEKFYWPTLRKVLLGLIDEGLVPMLFAEGRYNHRLEQVTDLPRASVLWHFDQTDMAEAKRLLGGSQCIAGNIPTSVLVTGTPGDVKEYCRKLIETCAPGGGYILTGGAAIDKGNPDNLRAVMAAAREYGVYK
ncbi:MAG: uroporphyrinogen decarboxylase family protein [Chloroflexota bacterium]